MQAKTLERQFLFNGQTLPDLGGHYSPAQLKDLYASNFPDLLNAEIEGPNVKDGKAVYTFKRTTGTKGRTATQLPKLPESFSSRLSMVAAGQVGPLAPLDRIEPPLKMLELHSSMVRAFNGPAQSKMVMPTRGLPSEALPLLF